MKRLIENIKNIWKVQELRKRLLITLSLVLVFRVGSFIVLPGVDSAKLATGPANLGTIEGLLGLLSGGGFTQASFLALGIMPYIDASIIMQLLGMAVPAVQKMQEEGQSGKKKIDKYTRILTIIICAVQAPGYLSLYVAGKGAIPDVFMNDPIWWVQSCLVLIAGGMFAVWLGERITDRGVGNGISLLITVGIIARLPQAFFAEVAQHSILLVVIEVIVFIILTGLTVLIVQGVRKIPLQYAKRVASGAVRGAVDSRGARSYLPIKVNASGVMPIIFAQAIMTVPVMLMQQSFGIFGFWYNFVLAVLIIIFTYFYTAIMINPKKIADDMKRNGGFIPGIRPGKETEQYVDDMVSKITLPGSISLALIAVIPAIAVIFGVGNSFAQFFGGVSLLIIVAVVIDTLQQIESYLLNRHYDGLMEGTKVRGRRTQGELSGM